MLRLPVESGFQRDVGLPTVCPLDLGKETDAVLSEDGAYPRQKRGREQ